MRKLHFLLRAKALVAFPGGFGTLDELFDALTLRQTGRMQAIPIILFGREYWERVDRLPVPGRSGNDRRRRPRSVELCRDGRRSVGDDTEVPRRRTRNRLRTGESIRVALSPFAPRKQRNFRGAKGDTYSCAGPKRVSFPFLTLRSVPMSRSLEVRLVGGDAGGWRGLAALRPRTTSLRRRNPMARSRRPKSPPRKTDPFAVPEGTPKELIDYIKKLGPNPAAGRRIAEEDAAGRFCKAAEKILAGKPNDEEMEFAVQAKMNMLETPEQLADFAAELKKGGHDKLARQVRGFALQVDLRKAMMGGPEKRKKAIDDAVKFLEDGPPQPTDISLALMAGRIAEMAGDNDLAVKTYQSLGKAFAASDDERHCRVRQAARWRRPAPARSVGNKMKIEGKTPRRRGLRLVEVRRQGRAGRFLGHLVRPLRRRNPRHEEVLRTLSRQGLRDRRPELRPQSAPIWRSLSRKRKSPGRSSSATASPAPRWSTTASWESPR